MATMVTSSTKRRYQFIDCQLSWPRRTMAWFIYVRSARLCRQLQRSDPGALAVAYAEAHLQIR